MSSNTARLRRDRVLSAGRARQLLLAAPFALAVAYAIQLLAEFHSVLDATFSNADVASPEHIAELMPRAPAHATVVLGYVPWYTALWFELLTRTLPFHRDLWEVVPWLGSLIGIALLSWTTAKAAGRWAGGLVAAVLFAAGAGRLSILFAWGSWHGSVAAHACLLGAFLVLLVERGGTIGPPLLNLVLCILVAAVTAAGAASDKLVYSAGIVPLVATGLLAAAVLRTEAARRIGFTSIGVGVAAVAGAQVVSSAMRARGIVQAPLKTTFVSWDGLGTNASGFAQSLAGLFEGDFGGRSPDARAVLSFVCALIVLAASVLAYRTGRDTLAIIARELRSGEPTTDTTGTVRRVHVVFWFLAGTVTAATFLLSSFGGAAKERYVLAVGYAIVTLAAIAASRSGVWQRSAITAGACILIAASIVSIAPRYLEGHNLPSATFVKTLRAFAQSEGLTCGILARSPLVVGRARARPPVPGRGLRRAARALPG